MKGIHAGATRCVPLLFLLCTMPAVAGLVPGDLMFTGEYRFDTPVAFVVDAGGQSGDIFARVGGLDTTTTLVDDGITSGVNPILATLTHHGDGVAGAGDGFGGSVVAGSLGFGGFFGDTDLGDGGQTMPLTVTNSNPIHPYRVFFSLTFSHSVDASGPDSFANSDLEVEVNGVEFFEKELWSDTLFGNAFNDAPFPGFGGLVSDAGVVLFFLDVAPSGMFTVGLDHTWQGGVFDDSLPAGTSLGASYFLSVDNIQKIPEPGTFGMLGAGLLALAIMGRTLRRRSEKARAASD